MKHPKIPRGDSYGLDTKMTPMIDVIFQLMIFFLCTAGFAIPEQILPTNLPLEGAISTTSLPPKEEPDVMRIELAGEGTEIAFRVNGRPVAGMEALKERIRQVARIATGTPVVLDIAPTVAIGPVIFVYDTSLSAGLSKVHFAARRSVTP